MEMKVKYNREYFCHIRNKNIAEWGYISLIVCIYTAISDIFSCFVDERSGIAAVRADRKVYAGASEVLWCKCIIVWIYIKS